MKIRYLSSEIDGIVKWTKIELDVRLDYRLLGATPLDNEYRNRDYSCGDPISNILKTKH